MTAKNALLLMLAIFISVIICFLLLNKKYITNPARSDGFGAQYQTIIYAAIYAELKGFNFAYTPFVTMEHNYDNQASFLANKEELINLQNYYKPAKDYAKVQRLGQMDYINFFESNLDAAIKSKALQDIKHRFRQNKPKNYFQNDNLNIAIHIRRPNAHDTRLAGADIPNQEFNAIIKYFKKKYEQHKYLIHIYSQGKLENFKVFAGQNTILHINESIEDTFTGLALADVLVMSPSSFSYTAGLISNGEVYYMPFWHVPLPGWHVIDTKSDHLSMDNSTKNT